MGEHKFIYWFNVVVGPLLGGFVAYWIAASVLAEYSWCIAGEEHCVRNWVTALSGWVAAAAAGTTIVWLARQLEVARQQTNFVVGNADPTASLFDPRERHIEDAFSNRLQVVNWNRDPILIKEIGISDDQGFVSADITVVDHDPQRKSVLTDELHRGRMFVPGWLDRSKAPTFAEFAITVETNGDLAAGEVSDDLTRMPLLVRVTIVIAGRTHREIELAVGRPDALAVVS